MKLYLKFICTLLLPVTLLFSGCSEEDEARPASVNELVAVAGDDIIININEEITLDGSESDGGNDKPFTYNWSIKTKPQGSNFSLENADKSKPIFSANKQGIYIVELTITQGARSDTDNVTITVKPDHQGTPTAILIDQDINVPTSFKNLITDPTQPDYIVKGDIYVRGNITIQPGVVMAFQANASLQILTGSIVAKGTADDKIVFRALDNTKSSWKGIVVHTNDSDNEFNFVSLQHAGSQTQPGVNTQSALTLAGTEITGAAMKINNTSFDESGRYGLFVQGTSQLSEFNGNSFTQNLIPAYIPASQLHKVASTTMLIANQSNVIETGGDLWNETELMWSWKSTPLRVTSDLMIRTGLTLAPGVTLEFKEGTTFGVIDGGFIEAEGTEVEKITFKAIDPGKPWNGLFVNTANDRNIIRHAVIRDGGKNKISGALYAANVAVGSTGVLRLENSSIGHAMGYGVVANSTLHINEDVAFVNTFSDVRTGPVYPKKLNHNDWPSITGVWLDHWSFTHGASAIALDFFDPKSGTWFAGSARPWDMSNAGFGILFDSNGSFTWSIAEHSPMNGCASFSAEFINGLASVDETSITFNASDWRSKFVNPCDEEWNADVDVDPQQITISYEINKMYNVLTGEGYWELKFTNPDHSTFTLFRK